MLPSINIFTWSGATRQTQNKKFLRISRNDNNIAKKEAYKQRSYSNLKKKNGRMQLPDLAEEFGHQK